MKTEIYVDPQLGLPGIDDDVVHFVQLITYDAPLDYICMTFIIDDRPPVVVESPTEVGEDKTCEQMERVLAGDRAWTQLDLLSHQSR